VLPARAAAEVFPGEQHDGAVVLGFVHYEVRVLAPRGEEELAEAGALDALEGVARDDLIRVYVVPAERQRLTLDHLYGLH
jgi:hypothetical protein